MPTRTAEAVWEGGLKEGRGNLKLASGAFAGKYSFLTRFENEPGTNPEELIAGAHAGCFSMALSAGLERAGHKPQRVQTTAKVTLEKVEAGFRITRILLVCEAKVPGIDQAAFQQQAESAKKGCPISVALSATPIELQATLVK
jgi:osmotically inducible protein OsmC